jgi:hypothetical protein
MFFAALVDAKTMSDENKPESTDEPEDYLETFESFWKPLVCNEDGSLNEDSVKRELHDFRYLMRNASAVYEAVTGGQISDPSVMPKDVLREANKHMQREIADQIEDQEDEGISV